MPAARWSSTSGCAEAVRTTRSSSSFAIPMGSMRTWPLSEASTSLTVDETMVSMRETASRSSLTLATVLDRLGMTSNSRSVDRPCGTSISPFGSAGQIRRPWTTATCGARGCRAPRSRERLPNPLPDVLPAPPVRGPHAVQVLRTYPARRPRYPFAPEGERSIARGFIKAVARARRLIYVEDQYFWSQDVADVLADALLRHSELRLIVVVPRYPDKDGRFSGPPSRIAQQRAVARVRAAGGDRVAIYDLENEEGHPIYVHAKVCVIDDVWAVVGSDNLNRRSWTHDSELACAVIDRTLDERPPIDPAGLGDGSRRFARDLRLSLWAEHLGRSPDDPDLLDFGRGYEAWRDSAAALDRWSNEENTDQRPPGRARLHEAVPVHAGSRWWAEVAYRLLFDPDGRPFRLRRAGRF